MAENKTKPITSSVAVFLDACPDEARRADAKVLARLMQKVTGSEPTMWEPSIVGFDTYRYTYESGREGDTPVIGFSARKGANVLYGAIDFDGAAALLAMLGKHSTGKGCLYIRKLADLDMKVLKTLLETLSPQRGRDMQNKRSLVLVCAPHSVRRKRSSPAGSREAETRQV